MGHQLFRYGRLLPSILLERALQQFYEAVKRHPYGVIVTHGGTGSDHRILCRVTQWAGVEDKFNFLQCISVDTCTIFDTYGETSQSTLLQQ